MGEHQNFFQLLALLRSGGSWVLPAIAGWKDRDDDREMPVGYPGRDDVHPLWGAIRSNVSQSKPGGPS